MQPKQLVDETGPVMERRTLEWGERVLGRLGVDVSFDMRNPFVADMLDEYRKVTLVNVNATTQGEIRDALQAGVAAGEGIRDLKRRIADVFEGARGYRAERIARTEVVSASNAANLAAYDLSGVVAGKEWLSVRDEKTRDTHRAMDGQTRKIRETFTSPDGGTAMQPGGFGKPEEDINCRCTVLPIADEPKGMRSLFASDEEQKTAEWRGYDTAIRPWESDMIDALGSAFSEQERAIAKALDALA